MEHSEAVDLGQRIQRESGYDLLVDFVSRDTRGHHVRMSHNNGLYQTFYSEAEWEQFKEAAGWQEQMHWRPQPGGFQE